MSSGYSSLGFMPGNVLLAFSVDGQESGLNDANLTLLFVTFDLFVTFVLQK